MSKRKPTTKPKSDFPTTKIFIISLVIFASAGFAVSKKVSKTPIQPKSLVNKSEQKKLIVPVKLEATQETKSNHQKDRRRQVLRTIDFFKNGLQLVCPKNTKCNRLFTLFEDNNIPIVVESIVKPDNKLKADGSMNITTLSSKIFTEASFYITVPNKQLQGRERDASATFDNTTGVLSLSRERYSKPWAGFILAHELVHVVEWLKRGRDLAKGKNMAEEVLAHELEFKIIDDYTNGQFTKKIDEALLLAESRISGMLEKEEVMRHFDPLFPPSKSAEEHDSRHTNYELAMRFRSVDLHEGGSMTKKVAVYKAM